MKKRISGSENELQNKCVLLSHYLEENTSQDVYDKLMQLCPFGKSMPDDLEHALIKWEPLSMDDIFKKVPLTSGLKNFFNQELGGIPGSSDNPVTIETYNAFARYDEWPGGYVQGYGYVSLESSNSTTYGQPMIMGTSWVYKGISEVPVTKGRFYALALNSQWHGGDVDNYGYVGEYQQVLGSTGIEQLVQVYSGYGTIGAVVNAGLMLNQSLSQSQVYDYMNGTTISDDGLQQLLQHFFPNSSPAMYDDIEDALDDQSVIIARVNNNSYISNIPNHVADGDYNVVDYNPVKHRYVCFDSVSKQIKVIDKDMIDNGTISVRFYIIAR